MTTQQTQPAKAAPQRITDSYDAYSTSDLVPMSKSSFLLKTPDELIFKLVKFSREKTYLLMDYFNHQIGNTAKDTRNHVCLASLGGEESPEKDKFFEAKKILKELKASGGSKAEIARYEAIATKFKPTTRAWICIVTPGNPKLQAVRVPRSVVDDIFGLDERFASEFRPARKGALNEMLEQGRSPFDLKSETGWLKLVKTGSGLATRYKVVEHEHETTEVNGNKKVTYSEPAKNPVNAAVLDLTLDDIPNVYEFERKFAFTLDEARAFVNSMGSEVPERMLKKAQGSATSSASEPETDSAPAPVTTQANFADTADQDVGGEELPF